MITGALLEPVVDPEEGPAPRIFRPNCHEAQRTNKNFLETPPPPPPPPTPLSKGLDDRPLSLISRSRSGTVLTIIIELKLFFPARQKLILSEEILNQMHTASCKSHLQHKM